MDSRYFFYIFAKNNNVICLVDLIYYQQEKVQVLASIFIEQKVMRIFFICMKT